MVLQELSSDEKSLIVNDFLKSCSQVKKIAENKDIIVKILIHLPIKDLIRFKCVSKLWLSTISNPLFGINYYRHNASVNTLVGILLYQLRRPHRPRINFVFLNGQKMRDPFRSLKFANENSDIQRICSCNGLFCVSVISYETYSQQGLIYETYASNYYICNSTTNKSIKLPDPKRPPMSNLLSVNLAFDPQNSQCYKAICVWVFEARYRFSVYSSETRLWEDSGASMKTGNDDCFLFNEGVFWRNAINWVNISGPFLCFDVDRKCLKSIPATPIRGGKRRRCVEYFGESCDNLYLVEVHGAQDNLFDVSELRKDCYGWRLRHRVDMNKLYLRKCSWFGDRYGASVLSILLLSESNGEDLSLVLSTPEGIFLCYLCGDEVSSIIQCGLHHNEERIHEYRWYHAHHFIMSLSSV